MPSPHTLEKLRKLASVGSRKADENWLFYLSGEGEERQEADELLDILLFQEIQKGYKEQIFLDPPAPEQCYGPYELGWVLYPPGKRYCAFGLRENEWMVFDWKRNCAFTVPCRTGSGSAASTALQMTD